LESRLQLDEKAEDRRQQDFLVHQEVEEAPGKEHLKKQTLGAPENQSSLG
jgi:hypothetical protein